MQFYSHLQLDTSSRSPAELSDLIEQYVEARVNQHDELLYRVDETGRILGAVNYHIAHPKEISQKGVRHISVNAFIFEDSDRRLLLVAQRNDTGVTGNSCGGHLVYGDTPLEGICSEAREELFDGRELPKSMKFTKVRSYTKDARANDPEYSIHYESVYHGLFSIGDEVKTIGFVNIRELKRRIADNPEKYTRSLKVELQHY